MQTSSSAGVPVVSPPRTSASSVLQNLSKLLAQITVEDINRAERCGGGGFGDVYVLTYPAIGRLALKRVRISGNQREVDSQMRRATREAEMWRRLEHPNILPFLDVIERSGYIYLVSPFIQNGSLSDFTQSHPDIDRARLIQEAAAGIAYLHRFGIVHGDIKGANILVSDDVRSLLCDFGLAREQQNKTSTEMQGIGTVRWQSPELLGSGAGRSFKSDVWAFAMTIYEILSGQVPYHECDSITAVIMAVFFLKQRPPKEPAASPTGTSYAPLWDVAGDCWHEDPNLRPEMQEAYDRLILGGFQSLQPPLPPRDDEDTLGHAQVVHSATSSFGSPLGGAQPTPSDHVTVVHKEELAKRDASSGGPAVVALDAHEKIGGPQTSLIRHSDNPTAASAIPRKAPKDRVIGLHRGRVYSVRFSSDGKIVASGSSDGAILLSDVEARRQRGEALKGHHGTVTCLGFSSDGAMVAIGSWDNTIRLWNVEDGSARGEPLGANAGTLYCLVFSPDGTTIASGSSEGTIQLWGVETGSKRSWLEGHTGIVYCMEFLPDGKTIATGSFDGNLRLWDLEGGRQRGEPLEGHGDRISCLAISPDGTTIVTGSWDHTLRLWDVETRSQRGPPLKGHTHAVSCLAFSPDGTLVASGSYDYTLRLWDVEAGEQRGKPLKGHSSQVSCLTFSPDGMTIVSGSNDGTLRLWLILFNSPRP